jgi:hypothetical protein
MEQYCLLAKGARGLALADLIQRVTSDPQIFAFGELLSMPHIQEVMARPRVQFVTLCIHGRLSRSITNETARLLIFAAREDRAGKQPCAAAAVQHRHVAGLHRFFFWGTLSAACKNAL